MTDAGSGLGGLASLDDASDCKGVDGEMTGYFRRQGYREMIVWYKRLLYTQRWNRAGRDERQMMQPLDHKPTHLQRPEMDGRSSKL